MPWKFLNLQPLGLIEEDCVCRAISLGVDEDYEVIQNKLSLIGELFDCEELCVCCYKHLLDQVYSLPRIESFHGKSIREFIETVPYGRYIIRVEGHLTCAVDGVIYDLWDCQDCIIDIIWEC